MFTDFLIVSGVILGYILLGVAVCFIAAIFEHIYLRILLRRNPRKYNRYMDKLKDDED